MATQELDIDLVNESREESKPPPIPSGQAIAISDEAAVAAPALDDEVIGPEGVEAMSWALNTDDQALIHCVCNAVPSWCIKEQIRLFSRRDVDAVAKVKPVKTVKLALDPALLKHGIMLVERLNAHEDTQNMRVQLHFIFLIQVITEMTCQLPRPR